MNVLKLSVVYPSQHNPISGIFIQKESESLIKQCPIKITVLNPIAFGRAKPPSENAILNNIKLIRPKYFSLPGSFFLTLKTMFFALSCIWTLRKSFTYDVIHAHSIVITGFAGLLLKKIYSKPLVITVHGNEFDFTGVKQWPHRLIFKYVLNNANLIIVVSSMLKNKVIGYGINHGRIEIIPSGIDTNTFTKASRPSLYDKRVGSKLLLSVGYIYPTKGQHLVIYALDMILKEYPNLDINYLIIGNGNQVNELKQLVAQLGLTEKVIFLGQINNCDLHSYYMMSDVFVLPSSDEGFGIVYLESLLCSTPIIACMGQGPEDFVKDGENGYLVPPNDISALSYAIKKALDKQWMPELLTQNLDDYNWAVIANKIFKEYSNI